MSRISLLSAVLALVASPPVFAQMATATQPGNSWRLDTLMRQGSGYVVADSEGGHARLTLDPTLQEATEEVLRNFQIPYAGVVVLSVPDGRVLTMVGRSEVDPDLGAEQLALRPWAPAASVFKVVSAAALVAEGGLSGSSTTCYHGGVSAVLADNLVDMPAIDRRCDTLGYGIGKSQNAILAKLASRHLTADKLSRVAHAFGFGNAIPFDVPFEPSHLDVPSDQLEFARTAAGFWHSTLSPMHGALLAAAIANQGTMPAPMLIEQAFDAQGQRRPAALLTPRQVVDQSTAREVGRMMELTTRIGTAKGTFRDRRGRRYLPVEVAGKTGTLSAETDKGFVGYSWFVGYAPADKPAIAFAVALGNHPNWRIKATYVARRIVTAYLAEKGDRGATRMLAAR